MDMIKGLIGGLVGGVLGAAVWGGVAYGTGYEIGWLAWGIGAIVGIGVAWGARGGAAAGLLAVLSILGGKYASVHLPVNKELTDQFAALDQAVADLGNDASVIPHVAYEIVDDRTANGEPIEWPEGVNPDAAEDEEDFPQAVWSEARARWEAMSGAEQASYRTMLTERMRGGFEAYLAEVRMNAMKHSFGVLDVVFFLLAIVTAYKIGSNQAAVDTEEA